MFGTVPTESCFCLLLSFNILPNGGSFSLDLDEVSANFMFFGLFLYNKQSYSNLRSQTLSPFRNKIAQSNY